MYYFSQAAKNHNLAKISNKVNSASSREFGNSHLSKDDDNDITDDVIALAFKMEERRRLKEKLRDLDQK